MNWILITGISVVICTVFTVLGFWHRSIQMAEESELAEKIRKAEAGGSNQALTQHPQINQDICIGCGSCVMACHEVGVLAVVQGKARLVNAAGCVGHGLCEEVCPVGALTVSLGDVSERTDLPILSDERETSVPSVFIAGELGGIGLIRNAIAQGTQIINTISARLKRDKSVADCAEILDVLIVGSGPAGIAAVLKAHERGLNYAIIDQDDLGGTIRKYPRNKMTLTQPVTLPIYGKMKRSEYRKEELIEMWEEILGKTGIKVQSGVKLTGLEPMVDGVLTAHTSAGAFRCRHCVLALGRRGTPRRLNVPGEESEKVLYQLLDAEDYSNQSLLVVGGGDSAIEAAVSLASQPGNQVTLSYRRHAFFRIKPKNRENIEAMQNDGTITVLFSSGVKEIKSDEVVMLLNTEEGELIREDSVSATQVFVFAGGEPPYPLLKNMGIRFGEPAEKKDADETDRKMRQGG